MSKKEATVEELLTGQYIKEVDPDIGVEPNAELEVGEYLQFPDGTTQEVVGERHTKGGVQMHIPDGTRIVTNSIKINGQVKKDLEKKFNLNLNTSDTYAQVVSKYIKSIGLEKLNNEQEDLFKEVRRQSENSTDENTFRVNNEYLASKIYDIEQKKQSLEKEKADFFNYVYASQEEYKATSDKYEQPNTFKYGGISKNNFNKILQRYGMTEEEYMTKVLGRQKFDKGGEKIASLKEQLRSKEITPEEYMTKVRELDQNYDFQTDVALHAATRVELSRPLLDNINTLRSRFSKDATVYKPDYTMQEAYGERGVKELNPYLKQLELKELPTDASKADIKKAIAEAQGVVTQKYPELVADYMTNVSFQPNDKLVQKMKSLGIDPTNKEALQAAVTAKKISQKDLTEGFQDGQWWFRFVDTETLPVKKGEYDALMEEFGKDAVKVGDDLYLRDASKPGHYVKLTTEEGKPAEAKKPEDKPAEASTDIVDTVQTDLRRKYPRLYYTPDQSVLPPSGMDAHAMVQNRFTRLDPVRVGVEDQLQAFSDSRRQVSDQLQGLPPNQRVASMTSLLSQTQQAENAAITGANRANAEGLMKTEMFNAGQADKENVYAGNNLLNYEQRQLTAKGKTEEELRNYLDFNRKVALNNFKTQQNRNLLADMFPDFDTDFYGMQTQYDPEDPNWKIEDRRNQMFLRSQLT